MGIKTQDKIIRIWNMIWDKSDISFWYRLEVIINIWYPKPTNHPTYLNKKTNYNGNTK